MRIDIFTDGACSGNPGPGGYGILMQVRAQNYAKTFAEGFRRTTNNRMELLAVIVALETLKSPQQEVHIHTDSKYVTDAIVKKWLLGWQKKAFKGVKNPDLWQRLIPLLKVHRVEFHWVKGHAGHHENELVDRLAVEASRGQNLSVDAYFESL